jgi:hypothetical protein
MLGVVGLLVALIFNSEGNCYNMDAAGERYLSSDWGYKCRGVSIRLFRHKLDICSINALVFSLVAENHLTA